MKKTPAKKTRQLYLTGEVFDALPDEEKERIFQELERQTPSHRLARSRPLNKKQRAIWRRITRKLGRPRIGKGTTNISVSLERRLLKAVDRFAREHGMSRSELIARGVRAIIGAAA